MSGVNLAIGVAALLSASALLRKGAGSKNDPDGGAPARRAVSQQQRRQGRARRAILRALDAGVTMSPQDLKRNLVEGVDPEDIDRQISALLAKRALYTDRAGRLGRPSGFHDRLLQVLNSPKVEDEAAIRTVGLILHILPGSPLAGVVLSMISVRSREDFIEDVREYTGNPAAGLPELRSIFRDHARRRALLDLFLEDRDPGRNFNLEASGELWGGMESIPWLTSAVGLLIREAESSEDLLRSIQALIREDLRHIYDWILSNAPPALGVSFRTALQRSRDWHEQQQRRATEQLNRQRRLRGEWFDCPDGVHPEQSKLIFKDRSGLSWVELQTLKELRNEGNISSGGGCLRHCIGSGDQYFNMSDAGDARHFSLRAPGNRPLLTMTISGSQWGNPVVVQAKGFQNRIAGGGMADGRDTWTLSQAAKGGIQFPDIQAYILAESEAVVNLLKHLDMVKALQSPELHTVRRVLDEDFQNRVAQAQGRA
jgi:hypothetical protein